MSTLALTELFWACSVSNTSTDDTQLQAEATFYPTTSCYLHKQGRKSRKEDRYGEFCSNNVTSFERWECYFFL